MPAGGGVEDRGPPRGFIVVSGLPASGKSRLGAAIAPLLGLPLLDKDDFLEALYEHRGVGDAGWRARLSRESDGLFRAAATRAGAAVMVSFWRHAGQSDGGTPSEWLRALPRPVLEVHCDCPARLALQRFRSRSRHPGHLDAARDRDGLRRTFAAYAARGPLGFGDTVRVDTSGPVDATALAARIRRALDRGA